MIKLQNLDIKLEQIDVLLEDPNSGTPNPFYFELVDFPEKVSIGRTKFLIGGGKHLQLNSEVKIEFKDSTGHVVYTEAIDASFSEANYKPVSIVVYEDDVGGLGTLTITVELKTYIDKDGAEKPVPEYWKKLYNCRWKKDVLIDKTTLINKEPINFYLQPTISASEVISPYITISGSVHDATFTVSESAVKLAMDGTISSYIYPESGIFQSQSFVDGMVGGVIRIKAHPRSSSEQAGYYFEGLAEDFTASITDVISENQLQTDFEQPWTQVGQDNITYPFFEYLGDSDTTWGNNSPTVFANRYDADGTIVVSGTYATDQVAAFPPPPYFPDLSTYYSYLAHSTPEGYEIEFISASYLETGRYVSYAKLKITDMKTYSGDVDRIKVFVKPANNSQEINLGEVRIQSENVFVKPLGDGNLFFDSALGKFISQDFIDTNYTASLIAPAGDVFATNLLNTQPTMSFVTTPLMNGLKISGSVQGMLDHYKVEYSGSAIELENDSEYKIRMKLHGKKTSETNINQSNYTTEEIQKAKIHIYISGSAFNTNHSVDDWAQEDTDVWFGNSLIRSYLIGKRVYSNLIDDDVTEVIDTTVEANFKTDNSGSGVPVFYVESGEWTIADLKIEISHENGFSPDNITMYVPIDKSIDDDVLTFRTEFYNVNNEPAEIQGLAEPVDFAGGNEVLGGDSNLITGQVFVGNVAGSGIEIAGMSSGYIRSIGYEGFKSASAVGGQPGFLFWSGSVLPDSGDGYSGVGMEMHAGGNSGSFKFRTDTNELEIIADKFFVGQSSSQFVSGSGGNIEISSSNFHLRRDGHLIIGAGANISGALSANDIFTPAGSTLETALAAITSEGYAKFESASIAGWNITDTKIEKNNVSINSAIQAFTVVDDEDNLKVRVGSGSLAEITGSAINLAGDGSLESDGAGFYFTSESVEQNNAWPTADFVGTLSASLSVTSSNPSAGSKHVRVFIPQEDGNTAE